MENLLDQFKHIMNRQDDPRVFYAPGRVNLIGEHIDYVGGLVFPAAISIGIYGAVAKNDDCVIRLYSSNDPDIGLVRVDLNHLSYQKEDGWANYAKGIIYEMIKRGCHIDSGFDLYIKGNLPTASGLSSSAALELLVAYIANDLYHLNMSRTELALLSQYVENNYMGMHCGIMDQLIIAKGVKGKALLMDTATLEVEAINATFIGYHWVIMNTNYKRKTTDSQYNQRRAECDLALDLLKHTYDIEHLCQLNPEDLEHIQKLIPDTVIFKRVRHAVTEQARTRLARTAMIDEDASQFAELLNQSHASLKNDYEVTGFELDTMVEAALQSGAIGARVTGAGFGGCAIALVKAELTNYMKEKVSQMYKEKTGLNADFYQVAFVDGVHEVT